MSHVYSHCNFYLNLSKTFFTAFAIFITKTVSVVAICEKSDIELYSINFELVRSSDRHFQSKLLGHRSLRMAKR